MLASARIIGLPHIICFSFTNYLFALVAKPLDASPTERREYRGSLNARLNLSRNVDGWPDVHFLSIMRSGPFEAWEKLDMRVPAVQLSRDILVMCIRFNERTLVGIRRCGKYTKSWRLAYIFIVLLSSLVLEK